MLEDLKQYLINLSFVWSFSQKRVLLQSDNIVNMITLLCE